MNALTFWRGLSARHPLLKRIMLLQVSLLIVGGALIVGVIFYSYHLQFVTAFDETKEIASGELRKRYDKWVAWKQLGLEDVLHEDIEDIQSRFLLSQISIMESSDSQVESDRDEMLSVRSGSFVAEKISDYSIVAKLDEDAIKKKAGNSSELFYIVTILLTLFGALLFYSQRFFVTEVHRPLMGLALSLRTFNQQGVLDTSAINASGEIRTFIDSVSDLFKRNVELRERSVMSDVTRQVAHDIRSPLSALNMVSAALTEIPEEKRLLIRTATQRINDIANNLLQKSKEASAHSSLGETSLVGGMQEQTMICPVLDSAISEKRVQIQSNPGVKIEAFHEEGYGLFSAIDSTDLSRIFSNLLTNALEAVAASGRITVRIRGNAQSVTISIFDNGKGMPPEIVQRIGEKGLTFGKEGTASGSGLGLYHAKSTIEAAGGTLKVESDLGRGTMVTITLPRAKPPTWFQEELSVGPETLVVAADDDLSIHQIWKKRFADAFPSGSKPPLLNFSSTRELENWFSSNQNTRALFLVDYEFLGESINGLELIEKVGIQDRAVLVTSRFEEAQVWEKAKEIGVKIIPKGLAPYVPIVAVAGHKLELNWNSVGEDTSKIGARNFV